MTPDTTVNYQRKLQQFQRWAADNGLALIGDVDANSLRRFFVDLQQRRLSSQYEHNIARSVRAFLNYCVRDELIATSPFAKVKMPRLEKKVLSALNPAEVQALLRACRLERDRALLVFLLDTGVRAQELCSLNVGDVDLRTGTVTVRRGKGQKGRTVYIGARTRKELRRYLGERAEISDDAPLFASERGGRRLRVDSVVKIFARLRETSKVRGATAHAMRRTFAISALRSGMNVHVLAKLMGHADIVILRQYLDLAESDLQKSHGEHGPVDQLGA